MSGRGPGRIFATYSKFGSGYWANDPVELEDGVVVARTLFTDKIHDAIVRVINLTDETYYVKREQYFGEASRVEVCDTETHGTDLGPGFRANSVRQTTSSEGSEMNGIEHIEC